MLIVELGQVLLIVPTMSNTPNVGPRAVFDVTHTSFGRKSLDSALPAPGMRAVMRKILGSVLPTPITPASPGLGSVD